jgi:hypothetical protein
LGSTTGGHSVTATPGSGSGSATFTATAFQPGTPASAEKLEGDGQTGLVGFAVNIQPAVLVKDGADSPLPGINVTFSVTGGGGTVDGGASSMVATDANGIARAVDWELGASPASNTLGADVAGTGITGDPATFTASGVNSSYDIEIRPALGTTLTGTIQAAFSSAEAMWEQLIFGDLSPVPVTRSQGDCNLDSLPAINETVDDLLIIAQVDAIDGPSGTLGFAGPCLIRTSNTLTVLGIMVFDEADTAAFAAQLDRIVLHEMGHVIGVGSLWGPPPFGLDLLRNPSLTLGPGVDTYFDGPRAVAEFDALGGQGYMLEKVPVHNDSVPGRADGHWRESVLVTELMTPLLDIPSNPLSRLTTASLWDLGYQVNLAGSDAYTVPPAPPAMAAAVGIDLSGDIWPGPVEAVDASGRVVYRLR